MSILFKLYLPLLACLGGLLAGYDTGIIGSALLFVQSQFQLTQFSEGLLASIIIPGVMLGVLITSLISDRFDHRLFITVAALIYLAGFVLAASAVTISFLFFGRILAGIAIGIIFVIVPLYLAEISPVKFRGRFIATFQLAITLGILSGYLVSYWFAHYAAWRWMFAAGLVWAFLLLMTSFYLPLSSCTLGKKRPEKSQRISFKNVICAEYRRPFMIGIGLAILQQVTGINAILYFAPQILLSVHQQLNTTAVSSGLIIASGNFLFTIMALFVLDSIGRRPVLVFSMICQCVALAVLGVASWLPQLHAETVLFLSCLLIYFLGFAVGLGPVTWLIIAEIYPSSIRGKAIGLSVMINNITAFVVAGFFLTVLHKIGIANTFWLFSIVSLLGLLFVWRFVPETKQQSLDDIQVKLKQYQSSNPK